MPLNLSYAVHAAVWNTTVMPGCKGYAIQAGRETRIAGHGGAAFPRLASAARYSQMASLTTTSLKSMWSKLTASTLVPCADLSANGPLALYAARLDETLPQFLSGANHEKLTISRGLACLRSLAWSQPGQGAIMEVGVWPTSSDGQTNSWDPGSAGVALPTLPAAEEDYDLHSFALGATPMEGMTDFRLVIDTGAVLKHNPGGLYPQWISQAPANGLIRVGASFRLPDRSLLRQWGPHFKGAALDTMAVSFRQFKQAAARDTVGQVDVSLVGAVQVTDANDDRPGSVQVQIDGISTNGITSPFSWTLN